MEYYSCEWLQDFYIMFNGDLDQKNFMAFCCESVNNYPGLSIKNRTAIESLDYFLDYRERVISFSENFSFFHPNSKFKPPINGCKDCVHFKKTEWKTAEKIKRVNFSIYPSPCQSKCIYCGVNQAKIDFSNEIKEKYEKVFAVVDEAIERGLVTDDTEYQVSCGEISIHPYKDRIYELVKNKPTIFYTNCFKYDEHIADCLSKSPKSSINLSLDAGLSDTWYKVKGFNNFEMVLANLFKYHDAAQEPNQITLKYIVIPGINDTEEDFLNLISIMRELSITHLAISRDFSTKYNPNFDKTQLIYSVAYLLALCLYSDIECTLANTFSEDEGNLILNTVKMIVEEESN